MKLNIQYELTHKNDALKEMYIVTSSAHEIFVS